MEQKQNSSNMQSESATNEEDISVLDVLIVLAKHKKTLLRMPLIAAAVTAGLTLLMSDIYTAKTIIMPPQQSQSSAAMMLGTLTGYAGGFGSVLGLKNPSDMYVSMLSGRTVADNLIKRFGLLERYNVESMADAYEELGSLVNISAGKDGLITVEADDKDPVFAAKLANAYVDELYLMTNVLALTEASQRRLFFEKQLKEAKEGLASAEMAFKSAQEKTGIIQLETQGEAIITAIGELRAQIAAKEVELSAMRTFATDQNPDFKRIQGVLAGLRGQLAKLEHNETEDGDVIIPTGSVPEVGLEYARRLRDVKYYETVFELLSKQFEIAKIDEAKDASVIQIVDRAVPPDEKSRPHRALIVIIVAFVSGFISILWVLIKDKQLQARQDPVFSAKLDVFFANLRRKNL